MDNTCFLDNCFGDIACEEIPAIPPVPKRNKIKSISYLNLTQNIRKTLKLQQKPNLRESILNWSNSHTLLKLIEKELNPDFTGKIRIWKEREYPMGGVRAKPLLSCRRPYLEVSKMLEVGFS